MHKWEKLNWWQKVNVIREFNSSESQNAATWEEGWTITHSPLQWVCADAAGSPWYSRETLRAGNYRDLSLSLIMPVFVGPHIYACACKSSHLCIHVHVFVHVEDFRKWRWPYQTSVKQMQRACNNHWEFPSQWRKLQNHPSPMFFRINYFRYKWSWWAAALKRFNGLQFRLY